MDIELMNLNKEFNTKCNICVIYKKYSLTIICQLMLIAMYLKVFEIGCKVRVSDTHYLLFI